MAEEASGGGSGGPGDGKSGESTPWRPEGKPILNALMDHVPGGARPWQAGHGLDVRGLGGLVSRERRRYTIVGGGDYANYIGGGQRVVAGTQSLRTGGHLTVGIGKREDAGDDAGDDVPWGRDSLTVDGDARLSFHSRTLSMTGVVMRNWNGGVMRLASMEGVICGGAFLRLIASPSVTMGGMVTGDVYGGCARVAAVRTNLALLHYRAAAAAAWATGIYVRNTSATIEPVVNVPTQGVTMGKLASRLARLNKAVDVARMLCAPLDILLGVALLIPLGIYALIRLIMSMVSTPNPVPPTGPPRTRVMNVGVYIANTGMFTAT